MTLSIKPFKAFRPQQKRAEEVVLPTFDNLTNKQLNKILKDSEYNFLNVVSPKAFYPNITKKNSKKHAIEHLKSMIDNNIIFQENEECFYVYCLDKYNKMQFGIVASIEFREGNYKILKHEAIFKSRSNSIMETIEHTKMQIGPVYLSYKNQNNKPIDLKKYQRKKPLYKFKSPGGTTRSLWKVNNKKEIISLKKRLSKINKFYIADGHHRYSAIVNLNKKNNRNKNKKEKIKLLAAIFDEHSVNILSFHRLAKFRNFNHRKIILELKKRFRLEKKQKFKNPCDPGMVMIYLKKTWYNVSLQSNQKLYTKYETDTDIVEKIMINNIIKKQCNCSLVNMSNIPGKFNHKKLANEVDKGVADIGFFICPLSMKKIMSIADKGKIVPKKSTYFDPKPADGLVNLLMDI